MKLKIIITVVALVLQLLVAFVPFIPVLNSLLPSNPTQRQELEYLIASFGISFTILTANLAALGLVTDSQSVSAIAEVKSLLPAWKAMPLRDDDFYEDFLHGARRAVSYVYISYLAPYAPQETADDNRKRYYRAMMDVVRKRPEIRCRRLVRITPRTHDWVRSLVESLEGSSNADVAVLDEGPDDENPLALSVQIIDTDKVWLVALSSHERKDSHRDFFIQNVQVTEAMKKYYDRLWTRAVTILDSGRITDAGRNLFDTP
jgi:hypothetical protein